MKAPETPSPITLDMMLEAMGMTLRQAQTLEFQRELELKRIQRLKDYNTWAATGKEGQ